MTTTESLELIPLNHQMIEARLASAEFTLVVPLQRGERAVTFGVDWPGDALAMFPSLVQFLDADECVRGTFVMVDADTGEAIGLLGTKGPPDEQHRVEIGYGAVPHARRQGLTTQAVRRFVEALLAQPGVDHVTAQTTVGNIASQRVLEKAGFRRVGEGEFIEWQTP
jgi:RimJ/RimL family protein N-acetyltransferase